MEKTAEEWKNFLERPKTCGKCGITWNDCLDDHACLVKTFHVHDCDGCRFLGQTSYTDEHSGILYEVDLYACNENSKFGPDIIARYGVESEYASYDRETIENILKEGRVVGSATIAVLIGFLLWRQQKLVKEHKDA